MDPDTIALTRSRSWSQPSPSIETSECAKPCLARKSMNARSLGEGKRPDGQIALRLPR